MSEKMKTFSSVLLLAIISLFGCAKNSTDVQTDTSKSKMSLERQLYNKQVPTSPPLYEVRWEVCKVVKNALTGESGCVKNFTPRLLWGPVGEAKLIEDAYHNGNDVTQEYHLAISSAGCFPPYTQRAPQAFYNADASFQVKKGTKPTISLSKTLLDNSKVRSLLTKKQASYGLIGNTPCKPVDK